MNANAPIARDSERADEAITGVSPDLIEGRIEAHSEPPNKQISTLLNQLIQENSEHNSSTAGPRTHRIQSVHSPSIVAKFRKKI